MKKHENNLLNFLFFILGKVCFNNWRDFNKSRTKPQSGVGAGGGAGVLAIQAKQVHWVRSAQHSGRTRGTIFGYKMAKTTNRYNLPYFMAALWQ